jgi:hypothetical protein
VTPGPLEHCPPLNDLGPFDHALTVFVARAYLPARAVHSDLAGGADSAGSIVTDGGGSFVPAASDTELITHA